MVDLPGTFSKASMFLDRVAPPERKWLHDPNAWAKERARIDLWSKQREIMEMVRDNPRTAIASCHEIGKSFTAAVTVCWWLDTHLPGEAFVVTTAPTAPQVKAILWKEINAIHERGGLNGRTNLTEWYLGSRLVAFGRKPSDYNDSAFQGIHARYVLVVLDEACGIPQTLWTAASTIAANEHSRILAIGNPDDPSSEFANVCKEGSGWASMNIGYADTPNFTGEPVSELVADSLIHPSWVNDRREYWGPESALFQSKCEGKFPTVGDPWQVIPIAWANQCRYLEFPAGRKPVEAGIDVGAGHDRTVVVVREGDRVKAYKSFVNPDPMQSVALVAEFLREHAVDCAKVDTIGVGWGIFGRLKELSSRNNPTSAFTTHSADIIPINVAEAATLGNEHRFINKRAEMWWDVGRERCRTKGWDLSGLDRRALDDVLHELTMPKYEIVDSHGKIKIEAKEKIKDRLGASPDLAEALLLCFTPASWAANTESAGALINASSLLSAFTPGDMFSGGGGRGW
jgi:hypothetical protein